MDDATEAETPSVYRFIIDDDRAFNRCQCQLRKIPIVHLSKPGVQFKVRAAEAPQAAQTAAQFIEGGLALPLRATARAPNRYQCSVELAGGQRGAYGPLLEVALERDITREEVNV